MLALLGEIKMNLKVKKIISLSLLLVGITLLIVASVLYFKKDNNNKNNNTCTEDNCSETGKNEQKDPNKILEIERLCVEKFDENLIDVSAILVNKTGNLIKDEEMYIYFYDDTEVIFKYKYQIKNLGVDGMIKIKTQQALDFDRITKYELIFENTKKEITNLRCD